MRKLKSRLFLAQLAIAAFAVSFVPSAFAGSTCAVATYGAVGVPFDSGPVTTSGGTAPYTYSVVGTLPAGLTESTSTGEVTGTPTAAGAFAIAATDSLGDVESPTCSISIGTLAKGTYALGLANAYNLVALTGNISDPADITGRIAASGQVSEATTIGTDLRTSDPYLALATVNGVPYAVVAAGGVSTSSSFNVNAGGSVYSSTATSAEFNFANEKYTGSLYLNSSLVTGGASPINFSQLESSINTLSAQLAGMNASGVVCSVNGSGSIIATGGCPTSPTYFNTNSQHYNPSWLVLYGTSTTLNTFNLTQAQFQSSNNNLDIEVPTGSTVIINVAGASDTLQTAVYFQGNEVADANAGRILFNFPSATAVTINGQFDGALLAPSAILSGTSQMGGVLIAASIGATGEVHYIPFSGVLPSSNTPGTLSITCGAVNSGLMGVAFDSGPMSVAGGTAPYTYSIAGTLPAGLTLNTSTGEISGTPTAPGTFSVKVTDTNGLTMTACAITINAPVSVSCAAVTAGEVGVAFDSGPMNVTGGMAPYLYSVVGTLPAGLTLNTSTGEITGIPTTSGTFSVKVTDANGASGIACAITINGPLSVTCAAVNTGEVGVAFDSGPMSVSGGTAPYSYSIVGTLPPGLSLNTSTGAVTGTPTAAGTFSVKVTDSTGNSSTSCAININGPLTVTCAAVNTGDVGATFSSGPMNVSGGIAPYTYSIVGTLPPGLSLNTSTGAVTGTPTAAGTFTVKVTDVAGNSSTSCAININGALSVACAAVTAGDVGAPFDSGPMNVTGGTAPYRYSIVGTLPAGLTLNTATGEVTGTPTSSGTFTVRVTDGAGNSSSSCMMTINGPLSVTCATVNTGDVGLPFDSGPMNVTGGTAPYIYSIVGTLPTGLTLNTSTGAVTGTPTAAGTYTVKVTDATGNSSTSCMTTINGPLAVSCAAINTGEVNVAFNSGSMTVSGGTAPYTYSIVGPLPAGLALNTANGAVSGTPTASGNVTVKVTDAVGNSSTSCMITIGGALTLTSPATTSGEVGVAFNSGPMTVTGGVAPYSYSIAGMLPAGLTLNPLNGAVSGTPTAGGTFSVKVTDAKGNSSSSSNITINEALSIACAAITTGEVGVAFNSGPMTVTGGVAPYSYSIAGTLPAGLTLNTLNGAVIGTPTVGGTFSVKVTDAKGNFNSSCAITITTAVAIGPNDAATIGYWQNKNGQALIDAMNGGPTATNLATWLATNFPYLYGAKSSNNLTGKTNADVAALFVTLFGATHGPKTSAQVMAGALAVYVTDSNLAGSDAAVGFGFNFSSAGTGAKTYNVGSDGTLIGLANNTSYTILQLEQQANLQMSLATFDSTAFNDVFTNINQIGDLSGSSSTNTASLSITCPATTMGPVGAAFSSGPMAVSGGTAPYTYSIVGTLPAGLALNAATGAVTGTPTVAGTFSVKVTDAYGTTGTSCFFSIGAGYSLTVNPSSITVVAGQAATTTFSFAPYGGYVGTVSFSCSGLPAGTTCTFVPPSVSANGSNTAQTSTLTITTTSTGKATIAENRTTPGPAFAGIFLLPGLLLGSLLAWQRRSLTGRMRGWILLLLVGTMLIGGAVGCGSGIYQTVTPVGPHVVSVVAHANVSTDSAGNPTVSTQTAHFTLTVLD